MVATLEGIPTAPQLHECFLNPQQSTRAKLLFFYGEFVECNLFSSFGESIYFALIEDVILCEHQLCQITIFNVFQTLLFSFIARRSIFLVQTLNDRRKRITFQITFPRDFTIHRQIKDDG